MPTYFTYVLAAYRGLELIVGDVLDFGTGEYVAHQGVEGGRVRVGQLGEGVDAQGLDEHLQ